MELTDRASVERAADLALAAFGRVDVVVSSARYQGPGLDDAALGVPVDLVDRIVTANVLHPLLLFQRLIPPMVERGDGVVVHLTSVSATHDPAEPGAWGVGSAIGRAAAHRIIGVLHAEVGGAGVRCYNVNPGRAAERHPPPADRSVGLGAGRQSRPSSRRRRSRGWSPGRQRRVRSPAPRSWPAAAITAAPE